MHIGVFTVLYKVLFHKFTGDVCKKHYFSASFWGFLHLLSKPFVSYVGLSFCWLWLSVFFLFSLLLLFDNSSCYVLISVFVVLGFLGLVMWCVLFFLVFFGGFKGQVRWPKGPPRLALKPSLFVLFCFCFVSVCFVLVVGFCLFFCFCFCFTWKGLRVKWGGPLGNLTWPLNPP